MVANLSSIVCVAMRLADPGLVGPGLLAPGLVDPGLVDSGLVVGPVLVPGSSLVDEVTDEPGLPEEGVGSNVSSPGFFNRRLHATLDDSVADVDAEAVESIVSSENSLW